MPLFSVSKTNLATVDQTNFDSEKHLQTLIEKNLQTVFGCRLVASEYSTGAQHAGRIDTLALSEDNNPVIVEYKKVESSDLINQSLFYLAWIQDHRGDFEIAAQKTLGPSVSVDWSGIRVICIAPNYKKYDLHAAQVMGADLELWTYRRFTNGSLYLEEVFQKSVAIPSTGTASGKEITAGQKAALTRKTGFYTVEQHFKGKPVAIRRQSGSWPGNWRSFCCRSTRRWRKSPRSSILPTRSHRTSPVWNSRRRGSCCGSNWIRRGWTSHGGSLVT